MFEGQISAEEEQSRYLKNRRRILELESQSGFVDTSDGLRTMMAGRYEEAAPLFEQAISRDPNNSEPAALGGGFARELGKFDVAIRLGEHAVAIDPLCYHCLW
jgi:tetratricopeptide (TPR) repeat protein